MYHGQWYRRLWPLEKRGHTRPQQQKEITTMTTEHGISRRTMLAASAAALVAPAIIGKAELEDDPVRVGLIGGGTRGIDIARYLGAFRGAHMAAVCDVYTPHIERCIEAGGNPDAARYRDYHQLLDDPNVEAVVIATPDHWHAQMVIDAADAGKAVFCEKPLSKTMDEAKRMRDAVRRNNTVFQLGHQGRQHPATAEAGRLILDENRIGHVTYIKTGRFFNGTMEQAPWRWYGYYSVWERPDPNEVLDELDWEAWLGPAPSIDFNERHFWHWRCYWNYGNGQSGDLLSHELDHVQTVLGWGIPDTCTCAGHIAYYHDDREVPDTWLANYWFDDHDCAVSFEGIMNSNRDQPPEYIGRDGRLIFNAIGQDASTFHIYGDHPAYPHMGRYSEPEEAYDRQAGPRWPNHMEDFLQCVRTGETPKCNIDEAFIGAATMRMSVESYFQKRTVRWNRATEEIEVDEA